MWPRFLQVIRSEERTRLCPGATSSVATGLSLKGAQAQVSACVTASMFSGGRAVPVSLFPAPSHAPWLHPTREPRLASRGFVTEPRGQSSGHGVVGFQPHLLGRVSPLRPSLSSLQPRHGPSGSWQYHEARFCWFPALLLFLTKAFAAVVLANSAATSSAATQSGSGFGNP